MKALAALISACVITGASSQRHLKTQYSDILQQWPDTPDGDLLWAAFEGLRTGSLTPTELDDLSRQLLQDDSMPIIQLDLQNYYCSQSSFARCVRHAALTYTGALALGDHSTAGIAVYNMALGLLDGPQRDLLAQALTAVLPEMSYRSFPSLVGLSPMELLQYAIVLLGHEGAARPMLRLAQGLMVKVRVREGQHEAARDLAAVHMEQFPSDAFVLNELAISLVEQGRPDEALTWWLRALTAASAAGDEGMATLNFNNLMTKMTVEMVFPDNTVPRGVWTHLAQAGPHAARYIGHTARVGALVSTGQGASDWVMATEAVHQASATLYGLLSLRKSMGTGLYWRKYEHLTTALLSILAWCAGARVQAGLCRAGPESTSAHCEHVQAAEALCGSKGGQLWHPYWFVHMDTSIVPWGHSDTVLLQRPTRPRMIARPTHLSTPSAHGTPRPTRGRQLSVGISSYDFRDHAFGYIVEGWVGMYNVTRDRVHLLALELADKTQTARQTEVLRSLCRARGCTYHTLPKDAPGAALASSLSTLGLDLLVDAMGPTFGQRGDIMEHRPTAVQVLQNIPCSSLTADAMTTDGVIMPVEQARVVFRTPLSIALLPTMVEQRAVYMPHTWFLSHFTTEPECGYTRITRCPPRQQMQAQARPVIRLGAFVQVDKVDPSVLASWAGLMRRHTHTILIVVGDSRALKFARLKMELQARGVHTSRVRYRPSVPQERHILSLSQSVDLLLDTWVCNGHTTTTEALWAGVPVLTLEGGVLHNRVSSSLLQASGQSLSTLTVTHSAQGYEGVGSTLIGGGHAGLGILRGRVLRASLTGAAVQSKVQIQDVALAHRVLLDSIRLEGSAVVPGAVPLHVVVGAKGTVEGGGAKCTVEDRAVSVRPRYLVYTTVGPDSASVDMAALMFHSLIKGTDREGRLELAMVGTAAQHARLPQGLRRRVRLVEGQAGPMEHMAALSLYPGLYSFDAVVHLPPPTLVTLDMPSLLEGVVPALGEGDVGVPEGCGKGQAAYRPDGTAAVAEDGEHPFDACPVVFRPTAVSGGHLHTLPVLPNGTYIRTPTPTMQGEYRAMRYFGGAEHPLEAMRLYCRAFMPHVCRERS